MSQREFTEKTLALSVYPPPVTQVLHANHATYAQ